MNIDKNMFMCWLRATLDRVGSFPWILMWSTRKMFYPKSIPLIPNLISVWVRKIVCEGGSIELGFPSNASRLSFFVLKKEKLGSIEKHKWFAILQAIPVLLLCAVQIRWILSVWMGRFWKAQKSSSLQGTRITNSDHQDYYIFSRGSL